MTARNLVSIALVAVLEACAARTVPLPNIVTPRYPEFVTPAIPSQLTTSPAVAHQNLAWRFLQLGDLESADREVGAALRSTPGFLPVEATAGWIAMAREDAQTALMHFDRVLDREADYISALIGRGRALMMLQRDTDAAAAFEAALAASPDLTDLRRQIDVLKFRGAERKIVAARQAASANRLDEARRSYENAITTSPESSFLYRELASVERQAHDDAAALEHFRKAIELDPSDTSSMIQLGELLESRDELNEALRSYENAQAIEPGRVLVARTEALRARIELMHMPAEFRAIDGVIQITRAQLAALIAYRLGPWLSSIRAVSAGVLTDVRNNWAEAWILAVERTGIMQAYANHTFQPYAIVHRADLARVVSRLIVRLAPSQQARAWQTSRLTFNDLQPDHLAYDAASTAVASGVMTTSWDGAFMPSLPVSGAEAISMVQRLQRLAGTAASQIATGQER